MLPKENVAKQVSQKFSPFIPAFTDVFDEESFYICAILITLTAIIGAIYVSRHVTIKDAGHLD